MTRRSGADVRLSLLVLGLLPCLAAARATLPLATAVTATTQIKVAVQDDFILATVNASSFIGVSVDPISFRQGLTLNEPLLIQLTSALAPGQVCALDLARAAQSQRARPPLAPPQHKGAGRRRRSSVPPKPTPTRPPLTRPRNPAAAAHRRPRLRRPLVLAARQEPRGPRLRPPRPKRRRLRQVRARLHRTPAQPAAAATGVGKAIHSIPRAPSSPLPEPAPAAARRTR